MKKIKDIIEIGESNEVEFKSDFDRDYSKSSDSVFKIFDDRIEFYNPGKLPEWLSVQKILKRDFVSYIRNKQIADIFKESGIIEKYGNGIKRVIESFRQTGLKTPEFKQAGEGFLVIIRNKTTQKTTQKTTLKQKIIEVIKADKFATRGSIAEVLGISPNTVKEYIAILKKEQQVKRVGGDKGGYWEVLD